MSISSVRFKTPSATSSKWSGQQQYEYLATRLTACSTSEISWVAYVNLRQRSRIWFVQDIYPQKHSYFVLDGNNVNYVYATAHTDTTTIPVYVLRLSRRRISIFRQGILDATITETLATMHNGHGYDPLPLVDDTTTLPSKTKTPRNLFTR